MRLARLRFLYIDECLEVSLRLMRSECGDVLNVGSDEMVSINALVAMIESVAAKAVRLKHIPGPLGVRGRNTSSPKNSGCILASPSSAASRRSIPGLPRKSRRRGSAAACLPRTPGDACLPLASAADCARRVNPPNIHQ